MAAVVIAKNSTPRKLPPVPRPDLGVSLSGSDHHQPSLPAVHVVVGVRQGGLDRCGRPGLGVIPLVGLE